MDYEQSEFDGCNYNTDVTGGSYNGSKQGTSFLSDLKNTSSVNMALFSGVTFSGNASMGLNLVHNDNGNYGNGVGNAADPLHQAGAATVTGCTITNNGGLGASFAGGGGNGTGSTLFRILNNTITGSKSHALNFVSGATATGGTYKALVSGNIIGTAGVPNSGSAIGSGIVVTMQAQAGTVTITGNTIRALYNGVGGFGSRGIDVEALGPVATGLGSTPLDLVLINNDVDPQYAGTFPPYAIYVAADDQGSPSLIHAEIHGNTVPNLVACDSSCTASTGMLWYEAINGGSGTLYNFGGNATVNSELVNKNTGVTGKTTTQGPVVFGAQPATVN